MNTLRTSWLKSGVMGLALGALAACGSSDSWEDEWRAGVDAFHDGDTAQAERSLTSASARAESFGPLDLRLAKTLNDLALTKYRLGKYDEAEQLAGNGPSVVAASC